MKFHQMSLIPIQSLLTVVVPQLDHFIQQTDSVLQTDHFVRQIDFIPILHPDLEMIIMTDKDRHLLIIIGIGLMVHLMVHLMIHIILVTNQGPLLPSIEMNLHIGEETHLHM